MQLWTIKYIGIRFRQKCSSNEATLHNGRHVAVKVQRTGLKVIISTDIAARPFAYKALLAEDEIGTMLPCNVIVQEKVSGQVEDSAVDQAASMQAIENESLQDIATEIRARLQKVFEQL